MRYPNAASEREPMTHATAGVQQNRAPLRWVWVIGALVALGTAGFFAASLPVYYQRLQIICTTPPCPDDQLTPIGVQALAASGLTPTFYAVSMTALTSIFALVWWGTGIFLLWHKPADRIALITVLMLVILGPGFRGAFDTLATVYPAVSLPLNVLGVIGFAAIILFLYTFPDGRFVPSWTFFLAAIWIGNVASSLLLPRVLDTTWLGPWGWLGFLLFLIPAISSIMVQMYRYRRIATAPQRQQIKWVVWAVAVGFGCFIGITLVRSAIPALQRAGSPASLTAEAIATTMLLVIPLSIVVAIVRHRLFDIDVVINRTLVFGGLTASVVGIYVLIIGSLSALFQAQGNLAIALLATGIVAVLFQPLRTFFNAWSTDACMVCATNPMWSLLGLASTLRLAWSPRLSCPQPSQPWPRRSKYRMLPLRYGGVRKGSPRRLPRMAFREDTQSFFP